MIYRGTISALLLGLMSLFQMGCASSAAREEGGKSPTQQQQNVSQSDVSTRRAAGCSAIQTSPAAAGRIQSVRIPSSSMLLSSRNGGVNQGFSQQPQQQVAPTVGAQQSLKQILEASGKPVMVVDFGAPNCTGCIPKMRDLEAAQATARGQYFHYIVAIPDTPSESFSEQEINAFIQANAPNAANYRDVGGLAWKSSSENANTPLLPTLLVINTLGNGVKVNRDDQINVDGTVAKFVLPAIDSLASEACR